MACQPRAILANSPVSMLELDTSSSGFSPKISLSEPIADGVGVSEFVLIEDGLGVFETLLFGVEVGLGVTLGVALILSLGVAVGVGLEVVDGLAQLTSFILASSLSSPSLTE